MSLANLLWVQALSGAPLYLVAGVLQALWLHGRQDFSAIAAVASALFTSGLAVLAGVVIWGRFFGPTEILFWQILNLPALIACLLLYPLIAGLLATGFKNNAKY